MHVPEVRYARNGSVNIAYQDYGAGPTIVAIPSAAQNIEVGWEDPDLHAMCESLASFARVVAFDKRGTGMSDRDVPLGSLDQRADDLRAVMDAAGVDRAFLFGLSEGGPIALVFAAAFPERTAGLILMGTAATFTPREGHPWVGRMSREWMRRFFENWGTQETVTLEVYGPSADAAQRRWQPYYERQCIGPGGLRRVFRMVGDIDVRAIAPLVRVPALVIHRRGDRAIPVESGQYLAAHIPRARLAIVEGEDHLPHLGDQESWLSEMRQFVTGTRDGAPSDRVLATVLFSDLVGSTEQASSLGDRAWRHRLDRHDAICRRIVASHGGVFVKTTGDGILSWFDGPGRAVRCAAELCQQLARSSMPCRIGLHAGEIERRGDDIAGMTVHIAARIQALASPGEVLVSRTVKDLLVGTATTFEQRGRHRLKGVDDEWELLAVASVTP